MKKYETCLFDLYGTLVDIHTDEGLPSLWKALAGWFGKHGAPYGPEELKTEYFSRVAEAEARMRTSGKPGGKRANGPAGISHEAHPEIDLAQVFAGMFEARGVTADDALIRETAALFRRASTTHLRRYAGAKEVLSALRTAGVRVILLSNAQHLFTEPELKALDLWDAFDDIFISSDHGCKKPDPRFYRIPVERYGLDPSRCLMIGNDPVCDIRGAREAGMDAYYIHSALSPQPCPPAGALHLPAERCQDHMDLRLLKKRLLS